MKRNSYEQARNLGRVEALRLSPAHILVFLRDQSKAVVELQTTKEPPRWLALAKRMSRHAARRVITTSQTLPPTWKPLYLQMLDVSAGADATAKEGCCHG